MELSVPPPPSHAELEPTAEPDAGVSPAKAGSPGTPGTRGAPAARRFGNRPSAIASPRPDERLDLERLASLVQWRARSDGVPAAWRRPGVAAEIDAIRGHLAPLSSRVLLAFAYAREAERIAWLRAYAIDPRHPAPPPSAVDLAYAVRWLELGPPESRLPAWLDLLDATGRSDDPNASEGSCSPVVAEQ